MYKKGYKPNRVITPAELKKNFVVTVIKIFQKDAVMNNGNFFAYFMYLLLTEFPNFCIEKKVYLYVMAFTKII